jgi:hypothetical protein
VLADEIAIQHKRVGVVIMPQQSTSDHYELTPDAELATKEQYPFRTMSPEEYVARHAHGIGAFSIWEWKFRDLAFAEWLLAVHVNLHDRAKREACREQFLTAEECKRFRELEQGEF